MKDLHISKDIVKKIYSKLIYVLALVYILYYVACSLFSMIGLLTNGVNDFNSIALLVAYLIAILFGLFVSFFKFRFDIVFIYALFIQVIF